MSYGPGLRVQCLGFRVQGSGCSQNGGLKHGSPYFGKPSMRYRLKSFVGIHLRVGGVQGIY